MKILVILLLVFCSFGGSLIAQTTGCTGSASISVTIEDCTATAEIPGIKLFEITPNPAHQMFRISMISLEHLSGNIRLVDASGNILFQENLEMNGEITKNVNIDKFPAGIYWVVLQTPNSMTSRKLIIE